MSKVILTFFKLTGCYLFKGKEQLDLNLNMTALKVTNDATA